MKLIILCLCLSGCSTIFMRLPSVQNCQHVSYERTLSNTHIEMDCDMLRNGVTGE